MTWIRIGTAADFPPGELHVRHLLGRPIGIRQDAAGEISALELACRHQGADLSAGSREAGHGSIVSCPRHGWRYDLETGACLTEPDLPLRPLAVKSEAGKLYVDPVPRHDSGG
ncbi:MAG: Rieske (2Fe-2S) protein [Thermoanaerobaculia bacterium]